VATKSIKIDSLWKKVALAVVAVVCAYAAWTFSKWGMASTAAVRADDADVAVFLTELAPDDPLTHYSAAVLLERRFGAGDEARSLQEYETATALNPTNYLYWLDLGRARERSGDPTRAELALRRALELAPNYARVRWAVGNNLLRQGRTDEAFDQIRKAVAADPATFAGPALTSARQFLGDDVPAIKRMLGGSVEFDTALASMLIREKRYDEAMAIWNSYPTDVKRRSMRDTGTLFIQHLAEAKNFRQLVTIAADLADGDPPRIGQIGNGGFESPVKPTGAGPFEWNLAPGLQPQIVLSNGQKHSGNNSLLIVFNSKDGKDFRTVSQLIAVEPNSTYELEMFVRTDLKTSAVFKWEIVDAVDGHQLAVSEPLAIAADWSPLRTPFKTSAADGIIIRLYRDNCGQVCSIVGSIGIDDVSLQK
jgi:hypothetical protein